MAVNKIGSFAAGDANLNNIMTWTNLNAFGRDRASLTNWTDSNIPSIMAGSIIEAGGSLYEITTDTTISGTPSDGNVYIKIIPSGDTATFQFTNSVPSWDGSKFGYYESGSDNKILLFRMVKSGIYYSQKQVNDFEGRLIYMNSVEHKTATKNLTYNTSSTQEFIFSKNVQGISNIEIRKDSNEYFFPLSYSYTISGNTVTISLDNTINTTAFTDATPGGTFETFISSGRHANITASQKIVYIQAANEYYFMQGDNPALEDVYSKFNPTISLDISITAFI